MLLPAGFKASSLITQAAARGRWFLFRRRELLVHHDASLPLLESAHQLGLTPVREQFLGYLDGEPCYSAELAPDAATPAGMVYHDLRSLYGRMPDELLALSGRAVQVMEWDRTHQFCGACGSPTVPHVAARSRVCTSASCGLEHYPRVAPAMIVLVERGLEVLLARSHHFPPGIFGTLAGFVDPGESVEECVHREVHEETGVRVRNLRYFKSQPWPFPHSLMLGFFAEYESGDVVPQAEEIEQAAFFHVDALPPLFPGGFSVGNQLLQAFCERHGRSLRSG